jgi:protease YdgD
MRGAPPVPTRNDHVKDTRAAPEDRCASSASPHHGTGGEPPHVKGRLFCWRTQSPWRYTGYRVDLPAGSEMSTRLGAQASHRRPALAAARFARMLLCLGALLMVLVGPAVAEPSARALLTDEEEAEWSAVGRLNVAGMGHCTATLLGDADVAVTAAHCLHVAATGAMFRAEQLHFLPGFRRGTFLAHLRGAEIAVAPGFVFTPRRGDPTHDIALIRLAAPAPDPLRPLLPARHPAMVGDAVTVLSYGRDRPEAMSIQTGCTVTARRGPLLLTDCEAVPGISGAPVVRQGPAGPELVGIVSASAGADQFSRGRAIAVAIDVHLPDLARQIDR